LWITTLSIQDQAKKADLLSRPLHAQGWAHRDYQDIGLPVRESKGKNQRGASSVLVARPDPALSIYR